MKKTIPIAIVVAGLIVAGALIYINKKSSSDNFVTSQEAANTAISFINQTIASEGSTSTASLAGVDEESGVYAISLAIDGSPYATMYVSKDGKYLFPEGYDMTTPIENSAGNNTSPATDTSTDYTTSTNQ